MLCREQEFLLDPFDTPSEACQLITLPTLHFTKPYDYLMTKRLILPFFRSCRRFRRRYIDIIKPFTDDMHSQYRGIDVARS